MNPLDQLQPLIAPEAVGFWPPAPGWWLLLLLIPLAAWGMWRLRVLLPVKASQSRSEQPLDPVRVAALAELASLPKPYDGAPAGAWLQQINGLLKRLCRNHYPHSQSHTLNGRKWLAFLDNRCPAAGLTRWMILVEGAYKPECKLDDKAISGLTQAVDTWIRKHV
ncbi:DUF4381 domain-containing protein [Pseudomonas cannabina]|uniref:DUF4381 domain-containing protein n=5 Tax=Pseudomonas syringae group TaxID=136849 RepID=A0A3M3QML4_PSECA|nr:MULTISPECIES: DUF4381 domain-containing protein [Pseudomonas syringae group]KPB75696.1 Uncharacterized protein AC507_2716 [Pseudomonas syringae pv. maculicola]MBM0139737.1 DUF4381 domain-containing protein [Pseudomonas cannabina pv. alisalensis]QHE98002.1 DUF4381 family protein [Pseudomonas syringae pv. maculicola str. ES4326]QQN23789.1 DUF4381 domain-containing protein [Pseudomonas cannabina pv. alisalensis]RMN85230.1 hypothetical protein ALQ53_01520 [Pseudomonas cannabina]